MSKYLNPAGTGVWDYEMLRIFGHHGMIESDDGGRRHRLVTPDKDQGPLDTSAPAKSMFELLCTRLKDGSALPLTQEEEFRPTRWVIPAKQTARRAALA